MNLDITMVMYIFMQTCPCIYIFKCNDDGGFENFVHDMCI